MHLYSVHYLSIEVSSVFFSWSFCRGIKIDAATLTFARHVSFDE